jgi:hypothetical protein
MHNAEWKTKSYLRDAYQSIPENSSSAIVIGHCAFSVLHFFRPANCRLLRVDGSATRRIAPPRADIRAVLYDARNRRIAARNFEHFTLPSLVILRIVFGEFNDPLPADNMDSPVLCIRLTPLFKITPFR